MKMMKEEWLLNLQDREWPPAAADHDRVIVRAVVTDDSGHFLFVRVDRDDDFGRAVLIETAGGGAEPGEDLVTAVRRELKEELGAEVIVKSRIGTVSDYYNLIRRHNINHYFLCWAVSFGEKHLTRDEAEDFHLSTLRLTYDDALKEYERCRCSRLGRLIANREVPVLQRAMEMIRNGL